MSGRVLSTGIHDLKSIDFALVNLIAVEAPSAGMSLAGELLEFRDAALGIVPTSDCLQVVADELVQALAERFGLFTSAGDELVDRKAHSHSISGHGLCKALPAVPSGLGSPFVELPRTYVRGYWYIAPFGADAGWRGLQNRGRDGGRTNASASTQNSNWHPIRTCEKQVPPGLLRPRVGMTNLKGSVPCWRAAVFFQPLQFFSYFDFAVPGIFGERVAFAGEDQELVWDA